MRVASLESLIETSTRIYVHACARVCFSGCMRDKREYCLAFAQGNCGPIAPHLICRLSDSFSNVSLCHHMLYFINCHILTFVAPSTNHFPWVCGLPRFLTPKVPLHMNTLPYPYL